MSKTRDTGFLANVIQVHDTGVRIMSGSEMLMAISSSGAVTITGELSGSDAANALLLDGTGSLAFTTTASFLVVSASQQQISSSLLQVSASYISLSASYTTFSGSASTRITTISSSQQDISSSQQQISASLLNVIATGATTGSNSFRADQSITGSLVVSSTITAQTLVVQTVTSSIVYSSGSNNFGNQLSNNQTFTGSVNITGSLALAGNITSNGTAVVLGSGTTNYLPKFTGTSTIGNSAITDDGSTIALLSRALSVSGASTLTGRVQGTEIGVTRNGADTVGDGPWFRWTNAAESRQMLTQLNASNGLTTWAFNGSAWTSLLTLTQSGNLGLGVTPSAWSGRTAIQLPDAAYIVTSGASLLLGANVYFDGSNRTYISTAAATDYRQVSGEHRWEIAPSGTAGAAITFTQAMTLDASGRLAVGNTSVSALNERLNITGNGIAIEASDAGSTMLLGNFGSSDGIVGMFTNDSLQIRTNNTARFIIGNDGNITMGNFSPSGTPPSDYRSFEIGRQGNTIAGAPWKSNLYLSTNATITAGSTAFTYRNSSVPATFLGLEGGELSFANAASGTVGCTITFCERMRITSGGCVIVNGTSASSIMTIYPAAGSADTLTYKTTGNTSAGALYAYSDGNGPSSGILHNVSITSGGGANRFNGSFSGWTIAFDSRPASDGMTFNYVNTSGTYCTRILLAGNGIACFACQVCAPIFRGGSSLQLGGYAFQFTAAKNFNENTSDVEYFKIAMGSGQAAIFVQFSSYNSGTAAYKMQTYHGLLSNNWTGWVGCGIEVTGNPSCRANFAASSINSVATYSGCLVFRVSTTNNGTSTTPTGTAYITVVTDGTVPTFTQL